MMLLKTSTAIRIHSSVIEATGKMLNRGNPNTCHQSSPTSVIEGANKFFHTIMGVTYFRYSQTLSTYHRYDILRLS